MKIVASPAFKNRLRNPYNWLLYTHMEAEVSEFSYRLAPSSSYSILHFHWPEQELNSRRNFLVTFVRLWVKLFVIRRWISKGTKVVWTVHNLRCHEGLHPRLERWFWPRFTSLLDGFIALSADGLNAARREHPALAALPGFVIPHGHYRDEYPDGGVAARSCLGVPQEAKVLLFLGQIRPYKNVPGLIAAFREIADRDLLLYIAGEPSNAGIQAEIESLAASDTRIRLVAGHVPNDEVNRYFHAADLVVLPFRDIVNSGSALLALSFNAPILVPLKGAMGELAAAVGGDWVRTFSGDLTSQVLREALSWTAGTKRSLKAPLDAYSWPTISAKTLLAYRQIADGRSITQ